MGQDQNSVAFDDGVEAVGDCDDRALRELLLNQLLDLLFCDYIDISRGFVENNHLVLL